MTEILFKVALNIINQTKFTPVKNYFDFGRYIFISQRSRFMTEGAAFHNGGHVFVIMPVTSTQQQQSLYHICMVSNDDCNKMWGFFPSMSPYQSQKYLHEGHTKLSIIYDPFVICPSLDEMHHGIQLLSMRLAYNAYNDELNWP